MKKGPNNKTTEIVLPAIKKKTNDNSYIGML